MYTSGTVFHAFLGEKLPSWQAAASLVRKIAENYRLPYYTMSPTYSVCRNHGYITGEHYTCPECGEVTEVYSRITGYYRPVQNWNDGKAQEYKDRKVYDIAASKLTVKAKAGEHIGEALKASADTGSKRLLFTTKTCPNCVLAKSALSDAHVEYEVIDAEENKELTKQYKVMQAPTLVVITDGKIEKVANASNIKKYVES